MSREVSRRSVLRTVGTASLVGVTGCSAAADDTTVSTADDPPAALSDFRPAPASQGAWPLAHYDTANTNYNARPTWAPDAFGKLTKRWRVEREANAAPRFRTPAVGAGQVCSYDAQLGRLVAYDTATGEQTWAFDTDATLPLTVYPTVVDDHVWFSSHAPSSGSTVHALDVSDGTEQWTVEDRFTAVPLVHDGVVFLCGSAVGAYDAATGDTLWEADVAGEGLALAGHTLYVATTDTVTEPATTRLVALDATTGAQQWTTTLEGRRALSAPVVAGETAFLVHAAGDAVDVTDPVLTAFETAGGSQKWHHAGIESRPAITPDTVYASDLSSTLYAFDRATGDVQWTHTDGGDTVQGTPLSSPVVAGEWLYLAYRMRIGTTWVDRTWVFDRHEQRPVYNLEGSMNVLDHPVVTEDTIYLASPSHLTAWHVE